MKLWDAVESARREGKEYQRSKTVALRWDGDRIEIFDPSDPSSELVQGVSKYHLDDNWTEIVKKKSLSDKIYPQTPGGRISTGNTVCFVEDIKATLKEFKDKMNVPEGAYLPFEECFGKEFIE